MERLKQMAPLISNHLQQQFRNQLGQMLISIRDNYQVLCDSLLSALQQAFDMAGSLQASGEKGAIAYISFSLMQSNLLLCKHALQIDVYDERFLIDDHKAIAEWDFSILLPDIAQSFESISSILRHSMVRIQEYELMELQQAYQLNYYMVVLSVLKSFLLPCLDKLSLNKVNTLSEVQFTMGYYMERQTLFHQWRREA